MISKIIGSKFNFIKLGKKFVSVKNPLGRWKNESDHKTNLKIDWANEDHCGICSEYLENYIKNVDTDKFNINKFEPIDFKKKF